MESAVMPREERPHQGATLIVHPGRERLGPYVIKQPSWPETENLVAAARADTGRSFVVLRLIAVSPDGDGDHVTYLVEDERAAGVPEEVDHGRRMSWARPGAALDDVAWAVAQLPAGCTATQVRTWNLGSVWRLEAPGTEVWLKVAPPFSDHEGRLTAWLSARGHPVPAVHAIDGARCLVGLGPGVDRQDVPTGWKLALARAMVEIQAGCAPAVEELAALGVPDWRAETLATLADDMISRRSDELTIEEKQRLASLVVSADKRFEIAREAGIADSLVHGDAHPGKAHIIEDPFSLTILDWGDATLGCPLLDVSRMAEIADRWLRCWAEAIPGSDPRRAWEAIQPLAALREAVVAQRFLDLTEPSEHVYHRLDVLPPLAHAAALSV